MTETKAKPKKDEKSSETDKKTDEVKMLKVKENSNFGHFLILLTLNAVACMALKYHFTELFKELNVHVDTLEQNTDLIYR